MKPKAIRVRRRTRIATNNLRLLLLNADWSVERVVTMLQTDHQSVSSVFPTDARNSSGIKILKMV